MSVAGDAFTELRQPDINTSDTPRSNEIHVHTRWTHAARMHGHKTRLLHSPVHVLSLCVQCRMCIWLMYFRCHTPGFNTQGISYTLSQFQPHGTVCLCLFLFSLALHRFENQISRSHSLLVVATSTFTSQSTFLKCLHKIVSPREIWQTQVCSKISWLFLIYHYFLKFGFHSVFGYLSVPPDHAYVLAKLPKYAAQSLSGIKMLWKSKFLAKTHSRKTQSFLSMWGSLCLSGGRGKLMIKSLEPHKIVFDGEFEASPRQAWWSQFPKMISDLKLPTDAAQSLSHIKMLWKTSFPRKLIAGKHKVFCGNT